jgi:hypothetical protein
MNMDAEVEEVISAFVDGEAIEASDLASALARPGAREALIDFVRLRSALADASAPSDGFVRDMRSKLVERRRNALSRPLRLVAAAAVLVLASLGLLDLRRRLGVESQPDQPPPVARVIRYEPGVDWVPVQGR